MRAVQPLPLDRDNWAPAYLRGRAGAHNVDRYYPGAGDPEGMHPRPPGYHSGWDIFAPGGTPVVAPFDGRTIHYSPSRGNTGQVFGGVIGVESADGPAVVFRHVTPAFTAEGVRVRAGDTVARVVDWQSGASHAHMELYRFWPAAYAFENTLNPADIEWLTGELVTPAWYVEDLPHNQGGSGPVVVRRTKSRMVQAASVAQQKALGRLVSTMRDSLTGDLCVLWWLPGTHKLGLPVFGPGAAEAWADRTRTARIKNRGLPVRKFHGRANSLYPLPG